MAFDVHSDYQEGTSNECGLGHSIWMQTNMFYILGNEIQEKINFFHPINSANDFIGHLLKLIGCVAYRVWQITGLSLPWFPLTMTGLITPMAEN